MVVDFYDFIKKETGNFKFFDRYKTRKEATDAMRTILKGQTSINKMAKRSIAYYPIIASDSCNFEMTRLLVNAVEAEAAVMTSIVLERIGMIDLNNNESKETLINRVKGFEAIEEEAKALPEIKLYNENFELGEADDEGLNLSTIDGNIILQESLTKKEAKEIEKEVDKEQYKAMYKNTGKPDVIQKRLKEKEASENLIDARNKAKNDILYKNTLDNQEAKQADRIGNTRAFVSKIKKQNKKEPTKVEVTIQINTGRQLKDVNFSLGVKSLLHIIPSEEVIKFLPKAKIDTSFLIKLAKLFTGEIKFWRDFVFNLKSIENSFNKVESGKGKWYATLKRLTSRNNVERIQGKRGTLPTVTLVVSMEDVDDMFQKTSGKFDLRNPGKGREIVKSLSLLNLVIISETDERVWWLSDIDKDYDMFTTDDLGRMNANSSMNRDLLKAIVKTAG